MCVRVRIRTVFLYTISFVFASSVSGHVRFRVRPTVRSHVSDTTHAAAVVVRVPRKCTVSVVVRTRIAVTVATAPRGPPSGATISRRRAFLSPPTVVPIRRLARARPPPIIATKTAARSIRRNRVDTVVSCTS